MATTTPNFGWPVPTSTDLVKDGATAIEALGDGIDASLVDLKGGLTGQVLAKTTNTDMDFTWVTTDDTNAIQNAIVDAKGDIVAASANDTPARLAVGANGTQLVADSTQTTGLGWQGNYSAGKNKIINGNFGVWQRGTTFSVGVGAYTADRYFTDICGTAARDTGTADLPYSMKISNSTGNPALRQPIELPYAGNAGQFTVGSTWTISFYAKRSSGTTSAGVFIGFGVGLFTSVVTVLDTTNIGTIDTTWQRYSTTFTISASVGAGSTALGVTIYANSGSFAGDTWFTGVQLEQSSVRTAFQTASGSSGGELALCQRYFAKSYSQATAPATNSSANGLVFAQSGATVAASAYFANVPLPVTMRGNPTVTIYSFTTSQTGRVSDGSGTDLAASSGATNLINDSRFTVQNNSGGALTAATGGFVFHYTVSAEL